MKKNYKSEIIPTGLDSPLDELIDDYYDEVVIDISDNITIEGEPIRVELRKMKPPLHKGGALEESNSYLVGIIDNKDLPKEGEEFVLSYHYFNDLFDLGRVCSQEPIYNVEHHASTAGDCYYFTTSEGNWRVKLLDRGN